MSTQSNAVHESPFGSQAIPPAHLSATRPMFWSVRRELWEHRSIYIAPLGIAAVVLFGFLLSTISLPHRMRAVLAVDPEHQRSAIAAPYTFAAGLIMAAGFIVGVFYSLDALYGERRDRSILFWKSLPVSDLTTVLSKASIPLVLLPLLTFILIVATLSTMLLLSSLVFLGSGLSVATLWTQLSLFHMLVMVFYHLLTVHVLSHAPFYGWLLLVSAWARRAVFLWAVLPVVAISIVEKIAFNTSHFAHMLGYRLAGGAEAVDFPAGPMTHLSPGDFLSSPGLWLGLAIAAAFLAAAVRLRRYRDPI